VGKEGIGYGYKYPIFWIDRFHPHSVKQHTAFVAMSRSEVDAFHAAARSAGGRDNGPPGLRRTEAGYPPGYYAAFVLERDGSSLNRLRIPKSEGFWFNMLAGKEASMDGTSLFERPSW
jgi:hypothetical protein